MQLRSHLIYIKKDTFNSLTTPGFRSSVPEIGRKTRYILLLYITVSQRDWRHKAWKGAELLSPWHQGKFRRGQSGYYHPHRSEVLWRRRVTGISWCQLGSGLRLAQWGIHVLHFSYLHNRRCQWYEMKFSAWCHSCPRSMWHTWSFVFHVVPHPEAGPITDCVPLSFTRKLHTDRSSMIRSWKS